MTADRQVIRAGKAEQRVVDGEGRITRMEGVIDEWGALAPIPQTPSGICNCFGLGSGEVGLEGVPDGYRAMDQRLAKADRSSSEEVRFGRTQPVDEHEGTVARTECAAFQFGLGSVGKGGSVGPRETPCRSSGW